MHLKSNIEADEPIIACTLKGASPMDKGDIIDYRILGKRGNTTIPYALRVFLGFRPNDLLSFRAESDEVIIRREKICDDCCTSEHRADAPTSSEALRSFLSSLPANVQKEALIYLSLGIDQSKT